MCAPGESHIAMIPLLDAFNHQPGSTLRQFINGEMRLVSTETIETGQEVFNTYSFLDNRGLLESFGFVLKRNIVDSLDTAVSMKGLLDISNPLPKLLKQRLASLSSQGRIFAAIGPDASILSFVLVAGIRHVPSNFSSRFYLRMPISMRLKSLAKLCLGIECISAALRKLGTICQRELKNFPNSIARDRWIQSGTADSRTRTALEFRIQRQIVVRHCVLASKSRLFRERRSVSGGVSLAL